MAERLSQDERGFVASLLRWDSEARQRETLLLLVALAAGGIVIVATILMTLRHLTDRLVVFLTVPGLGLGVALILIYMLGKKRVEEKRRIAAIVRKLGGGQSVE